jgi:HSP20 family protein
MTNLLKRKSLFPSRISNDLFDVDGFFSPLIGMFNEHVSDFTLSLPVVNIKENETEFKIEMAAPGLEKKDFKVKVENGVLYIRSEKEDEIKEDTEHFTRREYSFNSFSRAFKLPENSFPDQINAKYENGILIITLPKKEVSVPKPTQEITVS